jgi:hypothetical protein
MAAATIWAKRTAGTISMMDKLRKIRSGVRRVP